MSICVMIIHKCQIIFVYDKFQAFNIHYDIVSGTLSPLRENFSSQSKSHSADFNYNNECCNPRKTLR